MIINNYNKYNMKYCQLFGSLTNFILTDWNHLNQIFNLCVITKFNNAVIKKLVIYKYFKFDLIINYKI